MNSMWTYRFSGVLGSFDPLRNLFWVFYEKEGYLDPHIVIFNHEYNHLIGILGRHLQVCLLEYYLTSNDRYAQTINRERDLVESFVPVWLA